MTAEPRPDLPKRVLRQTRWNLALAVLLLLGYAGLVAWAVYFFRHGARARAEKMVSVVKQRFVRDVGPLVEEATNQADALQPAASALFDQVEQDLPTLTRTIERQGKDLADHLEGTIATDLQARYRAARVKYRAILQKEFPEITDPAVLDRMTDDFETAFDRLIRRYHLKEYRERVDRTARLWKAIPPAPLPPGGAKALGEQLDNDVRQWVRMNLVADVLGSAGKEGGQ